HWVLGDAGEKVVLASALRDHCAQAKSPQGQPRAQMLECRVVSFLKQQKCPVVIESVLEGQGSLAPIQAMEAQDSGPERGPRHLGVKPALGLAMKDARLAFA